MKLTAPIYIACIEFVAHIDDQGKKFIGGILALELALGKPMKEILDTLKHEDLKDYMPGTPDLELKKVKYLGRQHTCFCLPTFIGLMRYEADRGNRKAEGFIRSVVQNEIQY
jgi:hypothetical protein